MSTRSQDVRILRDLAKQYAEAAAKPVQDERRALWRAKLSLKPARPLLLATYGMWNVWCREIFGDEALRCQDGFYRSHERGLRMSLFHDTIGDDFILEPWITQRAALRLNRGGLWGVKTRRTEPGVEGGAYKLCAAIQEWSDAARLKVPHHVVDEARTAADVGRLRDALGDILEINVERGPACQSFEADISSNLARLRGMEQFMLDMVEAPEQLRRLLAFMRDGITANQEEAEEAGDWSLTSQHNQEMTYAEELEAPKANSGPRRRGELWCHCAAQEYAGVSPRMHDEFLLQYQIPIVSRFGLAAYGCCEDLTHKIGILRRIPNLRIIAVTPRADPAKCAEQIGTDYVISWRPNPTNMVCYDFDEAQIRRLIREGLKALKGCHITIHLKDIETVQGDPSRLARWAKVVRKTAEEC